MTKDEILALIDSAITGQGTNVDGGGQLATILKGILELPAPAPSSEDILDAVIIKASGSPGTSDVADCQYHEVCEYFHITGDEFEKLLSASVLFYETAHGMRFEVTRIDDDLFLVFDQVDSGEFYSIHIMDDYHSFSIEHSSI